MKRDVIFIMEPYYTGSHAFWVDRLVRYAQKYSIKPFTLKGIHWKWRMHAGAIQLADQVNLESDIPVAFLVSDMLDLSVFKSLLEPRFKEVACHVYFHENQLTYPWGEQSARYQDRQYAWINFTTMLSADAIIFNSKFHQSAVFAALPEFLSAFPENLIHHIPGLKQKSRVIAPGIDLNELEQVQSERGEVVRILWNHRWEYDKNPESFFECLMKLKAEGMSFELAVCGEKFGAAPAIFETARLALSDRVVQWGYFKNREEYIAMVKTCHVLAVTSNQEYFGLSVMEAFFCGVRPLLPNRLSYVELFKDLPVFYNNEADLYQQLKALIQNFQPLTLPERFDKFTCSHVMHQFETLWSNA